MPPASKKDCGVILFDIASNKKQELINGLLKFIGFRFFTESKNIYRLILVNSSETNNEMNYPGICTSDSKIADPKLMLNEIENTEVGKANWIDAVLLGIHHLQEAAEMPGLVTLQLIFFTTFDNNNAPSTYSKKAIQSIINSVNEFQIFLYFIGPDVTLPYCITSSDSIPKCMKALQIDSSQKCLKAAHEIVINCKKSVLCNTSVGINLLISFKNSQGGQPWTVPLTFSNTLSFPASTSKISREDFAIKIVEPKLKEYELNLKSDLDQRVNPQDTVKGFEIHGKFIQMDDKMFDVETERCFKVIGFTDKKFVPETYFQGEETYYVLPDSDQEEEFHAFNYLVMSLYEKEKYGIVRRVYNNRNASKFFVLVPKIDYRPKCFTMTELPFGEYLMKHEVQTPKPSVDKSKEENEDDVFSKFFNSLDITRPNSNANTSLGPSMMLDIYQQKIVNVAVKNYLDKPDLDLESLDIGYEENAPDNEFLEELKANWPEQAVSSSSP